jgi:hypothetical protein
MEPARTKRSWRRNKEFAMTYDLDQNKNALARPAAAPRVDEALAAIESRPAAGPDVLALEEISALKAEIARIKESAVEVSSTSRRLARTGAETLRDDMEARIRSRPIAAVAIAAAAGFLWGITR